MMEYDNDLRRLDYLMKIGEINTDFSNKFCMSF